MFTRALLTTFGFASTSVRKSGLSIVTGGLITKLIGAWPFLAKSECGRGSTVKVRGGSTGFVSIFASIEQICTYVQYIILLAYRYSKRAQRLELYSRIFLAFLTAFFGDCPLDMGISFLVT